VDAVEFKYPSPENNDVVTLDYAWWTGSFAEERTAKAAYYEGDWYNSFVPTSDDYTFMGQSFSNFDSRSTGRARIATILNDRYRFADEGEIKTAVFVYTFVDDDEDRQFEDFLTAYLWTGIEWMPIEDATASTIAFGKALGEWVPDNTVKVFFEFSDYQAIGTAWADRNSGGSESILSFGNFDLTLWDSNQILTAVTERLVEAYPNTEEGQKYLVTYDTWEPGNGTGVLYLIFTDGAYVIFEG